VLSAQANIYNTRINTNHHADDDDYDYDFGDEYDDDDDDKNNILQNYNIKHAADSYLYS